MHTVTYQAAAAAEYQAATEAAAGRSCGPECVGDVTQGSAFQTLWEWSGEESSQSIQLLYECCELDSKHAGSWPSGKLDVARAIHAVVAATAS